MKSIIQVKFENTNLQVPGVLNSKHLQSLILFTAAAMLCSLSVQGKACELSAQTSLMKEMRQVKNGFGSFKGNLGTCGEVRLNWAVDAKGRVYWGSGSTQDYTEEISLEAIQKIYKSATEYSQSSVKTSDQSSE